MPRIGAYRTFLGPGEDHRRKLELLGSLRAIKYQFKEKDGSYTTIESNPFILEYDSRVFRELLKDVRRVGQIVTFDDPDLDSETFRTLLKFLTDLDYNVEHDKILKLLVVFKRYKMQGAESDMMIYLEENFQRDEIAEILDKVEKLIDTDSPRDNSEMADGWILLP